MLLAVDSSTLIAFGQNAAGADIDLFTHAMVRGCVRIPPAVISEVLSNPSKQKHIEKILGQLRALEILEGYWQRVGTLRCAVLKKKHKARLADAMIAQSCIDHEVPLITRDHDFKHFVMHGGLKLAV